MKTITEKFIDGKLVERITVEEEDTQINQDLSPWWGIIPPPKWGTGKTITTTDHTTYTVPHGAFLL